jgi:hypothetical protein
VFAGASSLSTNLRGLDVRACDGLTLSMIGYDAADRARAEKAIGRGFQGEKQ